MFIRIAAVGSLALVLTGSLFADEFADAQAKVKARFPKEFAEVQTLAATDLSAAQKKLAELARKGNIRLPRTASESRSFQRPARQGNMNFRGGRGGRMGGMGGMGMMRFGQFNLLKRYAAESQIKSKFAAEYAAADKQLLEAVNKIEELAKKAKVTLPVSTELQIRKLRAKAPEDFAALEEKSASDPRSVFTGLRELAEKHQIDLFEKRPEGQERREHMRREAPAPAAKRENPRALIRRLSRQYPEEMKEIMALRESDPKGFASRIRALENRSRSENAKGGK